MGKLKIHNMLNLFKKNSPEVNEQKAKDFWDWF
jgi:hypothetical protein